MKVTPRLLSRLSREAKIGYLGSRESQSAFRVAVSLAHAEPHRQEGEVARTPPQGRWPQAPHQAHIHPQPRPVLWVSRSFSQS